jgi:hypothetical protein
LHVTHDSEIRIFDLPLPMMPSADQERAITVAVRAFAQAFDEEVARARGAYTRALLGWKEGNL